MTTKAKDESDALMATRERVYTVDDVWRLERQPRHASEKYYLIDGELCAKMSPGQLHGRLALRIGRLIADFADERNLGEVAVEVGYHPPGDRRTVLRPDVAFESFPRAAEPPLTTYVPYMPDLAVEIVSRSQTLAQVRRKAAVYLRHGTAMVWIIAAEARTAEIWTQAEDGSAQSEPVDGDGELNGGMALPGFRCPLRRVFPES